MFICKQHFDASSYKIPAISNPNRIYLKPGAIPSILENNFNSIENEQQNEEQFTSSNVDAENLIGKKTTNNKKSCLM